MSSVPAWKRLGLKLKGPSAAAAPNQQTYSSGSLGPASENSNDLSSSYNTHKRKVPPTPAYTQKKKARYDSSENHSSLVFGKKKSVSFTADTKDEAATPSAKWTPATTRQQHSLANGADLSPVPAKTPKKSKSETKKKGPPKKLKPSSAPNLDTALTYLRAWHTDRDNWKFNKNHQTSLLKHVFSPPDPAVPSNTTVPASDIPVLIEYIRNIQGFVRIRLREAAQEIRLVDMTPYSSTHTGFPEGTEDLAARQSEYDDLIRTFLNQPTTTGLNNTRYSFSFSESEFHCTYSETNALVARRVVKRMRAEMVLGAIESDSDASESSNASITTKVTAEAHNRDRDVSDKRLKLNDGTQQKVKRKRKLRTVEIESDSSSDESSSSSDSDNNTNSESESESEHGEDEKEDITSSDNDTGDNTSSSSDEDDDDDDGDNREVGSGSGVAVESGSAKGTETGSSDNVTESSSESESDSDDDDGADKTRSAPARRLIETSSSSESSDSGDDSD